MKKIISLIITVVIIQVIENQSVTGQTIPNFVWERSIDSGWSTRLLAVGSSGEIVASSSSNYFNLLAKLSRNGDILWTLPYGGEQHGGGTIDDTLPVDTRYIDEYQGKVRMFGLRLWNIFYGAGWLLKWEINSKGQLESSCCDAKIAQPSYGQPRGILPADDGGMYLAGTVSGGTKDEHDKVYFTKTDAVGKGVNIVYTNVKNDTGDARVVVHSFFRLPDGGFVIVGDIDYWKPGGQKDVFVLKIDSLGNKIWTKNYGTTSVEGNGHILPTNDGGFLLSCYSLHFGEGKNYYIYYIKIDSLGNIQWEKSFNEPNYYSCFVQSSIQTKDNGFVFTGRVSGSNTNGEGDCYMLKIDSSGKRQWSYVFGSSFDDVLESVAELPNGNLIIGGRYNNKMYVAEMATPPVGIENQDAQATALTLSSSLLQSGETFIRYSTPTASRLSLTLYNSIGCEIQRLVNSAEHITGEYSITVPSEQFPTGAYFLRLTDGKNSITKPFTVMK